jgi:endo-1,4-beta-xylanase
MKKRVLSLLLCALIIVPSLTGALSSANAAVTTACSMVSDNDIQSKAVGATFEGNTWLQKAGSPTLTVVDNDGVKAINGGTPPSDPPSEGAAIDDDILITFNTADNALWGGAFSVANTTNVAAEWVSDFGNGDTFSLKGTHKPASTDYTGANNAIRLTFDEPLAKNAVYTISYSVFVPASGNEDKDTLVGPGVVMSNDYAGAPGVTKFPTDPGTINIGNWKEVNVTTPADGLNETLKSIDIHFAVNDAPKHPEVWYIDNIRIAQTLLNVENIEPDYKVELPAAGLNYNQYPALKDVYKNYFSVGTVGPLEGPRSDLISYHFNSYTPENEMKPQSVQNVKGMFTFDALNSLLNSVTSLSGNIKLIGHTLAWHSQSPNWIWDAPPARYGQPGTLDRATALANLNAHIDSVLGEYGKRLESIDVVNEAIGTANPANWKASLNKGEGWCLALGEEWVELAFVRAAKVVDDNGWNCKLYYNDFGLNGAAKAQTVYEMVKDINKRYAGTRPNGKLLIEGIGEQGHYNKSTKPEDVEATIQLFATLPGVSLSFTEVDIEWLNMGSLTPAQAVEQGQKYAQLFQIFKKYAAGPANKTTNPKVIERVTFWGSNDGNSWKSAGFPLLFNTPSGTDITAKDALVAVLNPDRYLEENPVADEPDPEEKKPIAGVHVYSTSKGDSWSGANIILGNNAGKWPWSTAGTDGKVAFTPEKDATYRIAVNYTSMGTNAIRVRWLKDESSGGYTAQDGQVVGASPSLDPSQVATSIPVYFNKDMSTGNSYTLVTEIKLDGSQPAGGLIGNIAIRGGAGGNAFLINWIKVEKIGTGGVPDKLLVNWPDGLPKAGIEGVHVYATNNGDSWSGANIVMGNNAGKWPWSTAGADGKVAFIPQKDATYRITVNYTSMGTSAIRVRWLKDESSGGYTAQDGQVVNTPPYNTGFNPSEVAPRIPVYFNSGMVNGGTYTLTTGIQLDGSQPAGGLIGNIAIRGGAGGNSFLINWIKVEKIGTGGASDKLLVNWPEGIEELEPEPEEPGIVIPPAGQTYEAYPSLKDVYKDYFTMGIFGTGEINGLIHNFAAYAPGNEMKPDSTQSVKGSFTYSSADNMFNNLTSRNPGMLFYGHTLAWHSQSPTWMWDAPPARYGQPGTFDRATALANLNNHIENVLGYFGGRLKGIDVVNEAVGTPDPNDWKASLAKGEGWYMALGWEWVELAFLKAAEVVDGHPEWDCRLIYNDFGLDTPNKARAVYEMVKDINERYAGVRPNGKHLIEVIGMQEHDNLSTNPDAVENSIKLFATLPGVSVNITEMDIGCPAVGTLTPENENNQAVKFAELFQIFKKYAAGSANTTDNPKVIDRVSICGVRDATSGWRAGEFALLFTSDGLAKQALVAVLDPAAYLATHEYIDTEAKPEIKPVDGVYVFDTGRGDAWTGANIILGSDASQWPWSTAGVDGKVAFTPEKDETYRLSFNYTAKGTTAIRVRWVKDNSNSAYTNADGAAVNSHPYSASQVAAAIPAYFNSDMVNMGSYTLTTEIKLDGSQPANGLIGNIAIRGGGGGSAYSINWIKVEKIGTGGAADELMVSWPKVSDETKHKITATAGTGGTITPSGEIEVTTGAGQTFRIEANSNYSIANVLVDGVSVGTVSSYTFNKVTEDHTISATFSYNPPAATPPGSSTPSEATIIVDGEKVKADLNPVKDESGKNATAAISLDTLKKALEKAQKDATGAKTVVIELAKLAGVDNYTQELPIEVISAQKADNKFEIRTPLANVTVPGNMFSNIAGVSSNKVGISIGKADISKLDKDIIKEIGGRPVIELSVKAGDKVISWNNPDATVAVTIDYKPTPEELKEPEHITVWYIDGQGKVISVPNGKYDTATGRVSFSTSHFSKFAIAFVKLSFNDIQDYAWAKKQIEVLAAKGIINKDIAPGNAFKPSANITRAEFLYLLVETMGLNAKADSNFADVPKSKYFYKAARIAKKLGITNGTGDNRFMPDSQLTRQDMMVMVTKAMYAAGRKPAAASASDISGYSDAAQVRSYAVQSVASLVKEGIIKGTGNRLMPSGTTTRAEAAVIMYSLYNK